MVEVGGPMRKNDFRFGLDNVELSGGGKTEAYGVFQFI
jgi:hypothetical protein